MSDQLVQQVKQKIQLSLDALDRDLSTIRTGRAAPSLIENLSVEAYGSTMKLQEIASITAPDPSMLIVQPWDASIVGAIANSLRTSDLNLNPIVEGASLRVPIPPLTTERRQEMVKIVGKKAEEAKVAVRSIRHDAFSDLKRHKDDGDLSQDEQLGFEKRIQDLVDQANKEIETKSQHKEQDLLKI